MKRSSTFLSGISLLVAVASEAGASALFSPPTNFPAGRCQISVAVADLDGDTVPDLVTANRFDDVSVLPGNGDGTFQAAFSLPTGDFPRSVAAADLDGDTIPDLVTANFDSGDVSVLLGNGDGTFQAAVSFAASGAPQSVAVRDLDRDAVPDLVTANFNSRDVSVLLNLCDPAARLEIDIKPFSNTNPINPTGTGMSPSRSSGRTPSTWQTWT